MALKRFCDKCGAEIITGEYVQVFASHRANGAINIDNSNFIDVQLCCGCGDKLKEHVRGF